MDTIQVWVCQSCEEIVKDEDYIPEALYECPECGTQFLRSNSYTGDNHQCPDDRKFSSKVTSTGCSECQMGEMEEQEAWECEECSEIFLDEDEYTSHMKDEHPIPADVDKE